ncbi:proteasome activator complex subunit 4-like [Liolophura sinensis]|uniref:proteasome activator complex subunit 4-like n=1 Tax=Liolophura sinensis TaxID=3198878 RepID=UPI0031585806
MDEDNSNREELLGFKPQKEIFYNTLLPYADKLDEESCQHFAEIKGELSRAVALRDLKVGASYWVGQLSRYIRIYGRKFSKDDHVLLIKLLYDLVTIPELEICLVVKFSNLLSTLLKKRELLTRDDLELQWKPLYNLVESILYSRYEQHGLQLFPSNIDGTLKGLVRVCRPYFPLEATQEMLDEWRPLLCPYDITIIKGLGYFENFLPTKLPPEHHSKGFKLWFEEMMNMWDSFHNTPSFENLLVALFSRLASDNIGYVDWTPYIPKIFTRIIRSYNLPVGTQSVQIGRSHNSYDVGRTSTWMAAMLGGGSSAQDTIDKLFGGLQTFYHPSNMGRWNMKLNQVLLRLPQAVVRRIHRERYRKPSWEQSIPDSHKMTDDEITRFVLCMRPVALIAIFGKFGSHEAGLALKYLATLRPELIVPPLLERTYPAMETLTEPHRLISCMTSLVGVAGPMLRAGKWYKEGPSHILPLLRLSLPGIDPNDFKKCLVTFQMISTFVSLVPLVDCSEANLVRTDLTEEERELCSATAQFEDFVLQYMDKIFMLIENNAQDNGHTTEHLNPEQRLLELGLTSTFTSVLQQSSTPIFQSALRRLYAFTTDTVLEAKVGGRFVANLCRAAARVHPELALKKFIPMLTNNIKHQMTAHGNITKDEQLDDSLLWNIVLLSEVVRCDGSVLMNYLDELTEVLKLTLHLTCKQAYELSASTLKSLLRALTLVYPLDFRSVATDVDTPVKDYLAIRDWGKAGDLKDLGMKWHVPSDREITAAERLTHKFLTPELDSIKSVTTDNMSRDELLQRLTIVGEILMGTGSLLPGIQGKPLQLVDSMVPLTKLTFTGKTTDRVITLDGKNVREAVIEAIRPLLSFMLASCEDDTKGLFKLLSIYNAVLFFHGAKKDDFDGRWKSFQVVKKGLEDKLHGSKHHIRALLVDRVQLQNEMRLLSSTGSTITESHVILLKDLLMLALSRYSEVRKKAQASLIVGFYEFPYSYRCLLSDILSGLKDDPEIPEYKFKGSLFLLLGNGKQCMAIKRNWESLGQIWPALVTSQHSEKPSILKLIDDIMNKICKNFETVTIISKVSSSSVSDALALSQSACPKPSGLPPSEDQITAGLAGEEQRNTTASRLYRKLVDDLVELVEGGKLRWKFVEIAMELLTLMLRHDVPPPPSVILLFTKRLADDSLRVRKLAIGAVSAIQKQLKRPHKKIKVDPFSICGAPRNGQIVPGGRVDNSWHMYPKSDVPLSKEAWNRIVFVDKTHWGYYQWPSQLSVYAGYEEQPKVDRTAEELTPGELVIYTALNDQQFVDKLLDFMSLEEHKGKDKFEGKHVTLFKGIFRNFGDMFLEKFKPGVERLVTDRSHEKHESSQRCAMEVLAGIIRGSKHWPYDKLRPMWDWAGDILKKALVNITVETMDDWGSFFSVICESRDPRKLTWMFKLVMESVLTGNGGSFGDASRLFIIQHAIVQQEWRIPEILRRLFNSLSPHLAHPYKNVRDRLGGLLSNIFLYDYVIPGGAPTDNPKRSELLQYVLPQLECLKTLTPENSPKLADSQVTPDEDSGGSKEDLMEMENHKEENEERTVAIRLFKTVLKWLSASLGRMFITCTEELFALLPIICAVEKETADDELMTSCSVVMAYMSQALIQPELIPVAIRTVQEVSEMPSWHSRSSILGYLQVMVFCNFFTFNQPHIIRQIRELVLRLLCDEQLEVRQMAAVTLSGLLHCDYLTMDKDILHHFEKLSSTKLKKRQRQAPQVIAPTEALIKRHAGVLGLSACVQAYPYDVPEFIPQILMDLSNHVNDPQPIQLTVKKTLSNFRRTHHDNWHDHKQKFTDDQLVILTDLLVSPNYYA